MKPVLRLLVVALSAVILLASAVTGSEGKETIEVYRNQVQISLNGKLVSTESLLYDGKPYLPVTVLSDHLGMDVSWNPNLRVATVNNFKTLTLPGTVDPFKPVILLSELGLQADRIDAVKLESNGKYVPKKIELIFNQISITDEGGASATVLDVNKPYTLKLYLTNNARYSVEFMTASLPDISGGDQRKVVLVPAMPEKGFYWPYYLSVPGKEHRSGNEGLRRYLVVDIANTGPTTSVSDLIKKAGTEFTNRGQVSMQLADQLWLPMIYPVFPRPSVGYFFDNENNLFYTHAFDRDTATLHLKMKNPEAAAILKKEFQKAGFDVNAFLNLDLQLNAMIDHAIAYLNEYGNKVEPKKVFLAGYSASGTFTDRYSVLQPDRVRAVASGATLDDMMVPVAELKGQQLIFPIGVGDYQEITGREFDLTKHNQVARLLYMGEQDRNNTLPFSDCYGTRERQIITGLWGTEVLPRAKALIELYGKSGGKGIFILDRGVEHGYSPEMIAYVKQFLTVNRNDDTPQYPRPANPDQLHYTVFE